MCVFFQIASELWPVTAAAEASDEESHGDPDGAAVDVEEDLEKQIAKELAMIKRPRKEQQFGMFLYSCSGRDIRVDPSDYLANCQTNTPCGAREMISSLLHDGMMTYA
jgi:tRNA acetyltransferase TAN1